MIERLQGLPMRVQVFGLSLIVPAVVVMFGLSLAPLAAETAMAGEDPQTIRAVADAVRIAAAIVAACAAIAAWGVAALLQGSIRALVGCMGEATDIIALGTFRHRIATRRGDELGRLAGAIDRMAERLELLEQSRRQVLAAVSHELRTPLTVIRGHAFTLGRGEVEASRRRQFDTIDAEVVRLDDLIEQLVDASSVQAGALNLSREFCELDVLVEATVQRFDVEAQRRGLWFELRSDADLTTTHVDVGRMHQVLGNIVANAVRHASSATAIHIDVARSGSEVVLQVSNTGRAIDPADAERIFEPFVQVGTRAGRVGLGLSIARAIVEAHGGVLRVVPGGAVDSVTFEVRLPTRDAPERPPLERSSVPAAPRRGVRHAQPVEAS